MYTNAKTQTGAVKKAFIACVNQYKADADAKAAAAEKAAKDAAAEAKANADSRVASLKDYVNKGGEDQLVPAAPATTPTQ